MISLAPTFHENAACKGRHHLFFPSEHEGCVPEARAERAIAICHQCPVLEQCRQWAGTPVPKGGGGFRKTGFVAGGVLWREDRRKRLVHGAVTLAITMRCPCELCDARRDRQRDTQRRLMAQKRIEREGEVA